jgi:hypothetical protein
MKTYGGMYAQIHVLTSALFGVEWSVLFPGRYNPEEIAHGTHWIGGRRRGEEKNLASSGTRTPYPRPSIPQPVAKPTTLSRLPYNAIMWFRE